MRACVLMGSADKPVTAQAAQLKLKVRAKSIFFMTRAGVVGDAKHDTPELAPFRIDRCVVNARYNAAQL